MRGHLQTFAELQKSAVAMELETEHLLTVRSPADACITSAVGLYGTEPVVVTTGGDNQLSLHRPLCKIHEVC